MSFPASRMGVKKIDVLPGAYLRRGGLGPGGYTVIKLPDGHGKAKVIRIFLSVHIKMEADKGYVPFSQKIPSAYPPWNSRSVQNLPYDIPPKIYIELLLNQTVIK